MFGADICQMSNFRFSLRLVECETMMINAFYSRKSFFFHEIIGCSALRFVHAVGVFYPLINSMSSHSHGVALFTRKTSVKN